MTEQEWRDSTDTRAMLEALRGRASSRKLRLLACACCRPNWPEAPDRDLVRGYLVAQRLADGGVSEEERHALFRLAADATFDRYPVADGVACRDPGFLFAGAVAFALGAGAGELEAHVVAADGASVADIYGAVWEAGRVPNAASLRDIFGNPFRPAAIAPSWLTSTVVSLARGIYDENAFERMPYLADALMDAGCDSEEVLGHCKGPNGHVKGCWLVDGLLGLK